MPDEDVKLDREKMESAADRFVVLGTELGLSREEMASVCGALAANHMIATGVSEERAPRVMVAMYRWRRGRGVNAKLLVAERAVEGTEAERTRPICDGCNVSKIWEHRCHGQPIMVRGEMLDVVCGCAECNGGD